MHALCFSSYERSGSNPFWSLSTVACFTCSDFLKLSYLKLINVRLVNVLETSDYVFLLLRSSGILLRARRFVRKPIHGIENLRWARFLK